MGKPIFADCGAFEKKLLPFADYKPGVSLGGIPESCARQLVERAEAVLDEEYPLLTATGYMDMVRTGNRQRYETLFNRRRDLLTAFALAEAVERKGRFVDRVIDGLWLILEESTWEVPAMNMPSRNIMPDTVYYCATLPPYAPPLPDAFFTSDEDDDVKHYELCAAKTGGLLAWIWHELADELDGVTPIIRRRIKSQLEHRVLHPFCDFDHDWWTGAVENVTINNHTPWVTAHALLVTALTVEDDARRAAIAKRAMTILDRYTVRAIPEDGSCDEGPSYWAVGPGHYFDCLEILHDMSGGAIDCFAHPAVTGMMSFIANTYITPESCLNFADCPLRAAPNWRMLARAGRRLGQPLLQDFAAWAARDTDALPAMNNLNPWRYVQDLREAVPAAGGYAPPEKVWYPDWQVAVTRQDGITLAVKGGHNAENHNHNDLGSVILFDGDTPILLDAGTMEYTAQLFGAGRYDIWFTNALHHSVAEVNGVLQQAGRQYHTVSDYDPETGALTLELSAAYPAEANIRSYRRSAVLADCAVTITDKAQLNAPGTFIQRWMTLDEPVITPGCIRFAGGHTASFDPALAAAVDAIELSEAGRRNWQRDKIYRIALTGAAAEAHNYTLQIKRR